MIVRSHQEYQFKISVVLALTILAERNTELYSEVLQYYLELQDPLDLNLYPLVQSLIEACGTEKAYSILNGTIYPTQRAWLFGFYYFLPQAEISIKRLNQLLELYKTSESRALPFDWDFLLNYRTIEPEIISKITELLLIRAEDDANYAHVFFNLFNPLTKVNEEITDHFRGKTELLKRAYFVELGSTAHADHDGKTLNRILDLDTNFIVEYIDWMYGRSKWVSEHDDSRDYSFIWERDDYYEIMVRGAERIFECEKEGSDYSYFKVFFGLQRNGQESRNVGARQVNLLMGLIEVKNGDVDFMKFVFSLISNLPVKDRVQFFLKFVELNNSFDDFKQMPLEPDVYTWSGSAVLMLQGRVEYLKILIPLFDTVSLLKHKQYIEHIIKNIRKKIEQEKKDDFMEH